MNDLATVRGGFAAYALDALPGLVVADASLLRLTDTRYLLRDPSSPVLLDLNRRVRPITGPLSSGWCRPQSLIYPARAIPATGAPAHPSQLCDGHDRPLATHGFAGARSGIVLVGADTNGIDTAVPA